MYDLQPTDGTQDMGMPAPGMTRNTQEWEHFRVFRLELLGPHPKMADRWYMGHGEVGPWNDTEHLGLIPFLMSCLNRVGPHPRVPCKTNGRPMVHGTRQCGPLE